METLKKNEDFRLAYKAGKSFANDYLIMYAFQNGMESNRYGISVSKKVGNSCVRHRVKRLIKEVIRLNEDWFIDGFDFIFVARNKSKDAMYSVIEEKVFSLSKKLTNVDRKN